MMRAKKAVTFAYSAATSVDQAGLNYQGDPANLVLAAETAALFREWSEQRSPDEMTLLFTWTNELTLVQAAEQLKVDPSTAARRRNRLVAVARAAFQGVIA